jgi:hypothetical protein
LAALMEATMREAKRGIFRRPDVPWTPPGCDSIHLLPGVRGTSGRRDGAEEKMARNLCASRSGVQKLKDRSAAWAYRITQRPTCF